MKIKRKTEIRTETERFLAIRRTRSGVCPKCGGRMLAPEEAAMFFGVSSREIYSQVESGSLHFAESKGGQLLVCANSGFRGTKR